MVTRCIQQHRNRLAGEIATLRAGTFPPSIWIDFCFGDCIMCLECPKCGSNDIANTDKNGKELFTDGVMCQECGLQWKPDFVDDDDDNDEM